MNSLDSVLDPSDWLSSKLPPLYQLDSMIRCHICKEFMTSPVLTGCGHCFCSLCIRSTLSSIGKCPLCNEEQIESKLRKNLILEEIIVFFKKYRADLKDMLSLDSKSEEVVASSDMMETETLELINLDSDDDENDAKESNLKQRDNVKHSSKRSSSSSDFLSSMTRKKQRTPISVTEQLSQSQRELKEGNLSECPICHDFFPLHEIETTHIDACLNKNTDSDISHIKTAVPKVRKSQKKTTTLSSFFVRKPIDNKRTFTFDKNKQYQIQNNNSSNAKPLKKLDFSSLNTTKLKEKLGLLALPTIGSRQQLEKRYNQYVILYNSNLDSINPEPLKKLRATLNQWEFLNNNMDSNLVLTTKQKNIDRENWVETHSDEFKKLIAKAKSKKRDQAPNLPLEGEKKTDDADSDHLTLEKSLPSELNSSIMTHKSTLETECDDDNVVGQVEKLEGVVETEIFSPHAVEN